MRFTIISTILASSLAALVSAGEPGAQCRVEGTYNCSNNRDMILVCQNGSWRLAALCNESCTCSLPSPVPGSDLIPYCYC